MLHEPSSPQMDVPEQFTSLTHEAEELMQEVEEA